jgi:hypothetical protein
LNFEELFPQEYKERLMQPIDEDSPREVLPLLDREIEFAIRSKSST